MNGQTRGRIVNIPLNLKLEKNVFHLYFIFLRFFIHFFLKKKIPVPNRRNLFKNKISFDIQIYYVDDITDIHVIFKHRRSSLVLMICIKKKLYN